ncbi:MAG: N-hydroxyarylamine O-acetyltransferase [Sulfurimonas sp.]|jgi:N-hydroxyarylamine O-acetyltransferase|uniref:arylamine N-acetyltransferase family protein n=1 Tax=Sulfurimonas sp. TaxID=2022749 RepID=UPI0039E5BEDF
MQLINNYLKTINSTLEVKNLSDIDRLIKKHIEKLPFCNIPILLNRDIILDLASITEKMLHNKEGGYCFEHNKLIYEALLFLGFDVTPLFGRVLNNQKIDVPKTHRITLLTYEDERYIIDVGFGSMSPNQAIKFGSIATKTILDTSYIIKQTDPETFELQTISNDKYFTLYSFDFHNCNEMDFEVGNFYSSKNKNAVFVNNLLLSTISDNKILSLRNNTYHKIFSDYRKEIVVESLDEFRDILKCDFKYPINGEDSKYLFEKFIK